MATVPIQFEGSRRSLLASSILSLILHTMAFVIASFSLRGCQNAGSGQAGGDPFRNVGLFVVDGVDGGSAAEGSAPGAGTDEQTRDGQDQISQSSESNMTADSDANSRERLPSEAPSIDDLLNDSDAEANGNGSSPSKLPALIGPGEPIGGKQRVTSGGGGNLIQPSEAGGGAKIGGIGGPGETTFMNISGVGKTFVYLIDTSSSMHGGRLKIAQSQLKASLRLLQPNQKFAVIFYNELRERLKLRRQAEQPMYFATDLNNQLASQEVDRITSDRGTEHKPAIIEALSLKPDVLYFLTDGDEPALSAADLREIARHTGGTTIHVVKFGDGTVVSRQISWLERLAQQSDGEFREIKVSN